MSEELRHPRSKLADETGRLLLRLALLTMVILIVLPRLPSVRFSGSALVAVMLAAPFAILGRLGHAPAAVTSVDSGGRMVTKSRSMEALTARRGGWIVVGAIWIIGFLIVPSLLLRLLALFPETHLEFMSWWSTLIPAVLFLLVHVVALSVISRPRSERL